MMGRKKHNPYTCFGCRLFLLIKELYPDGPTDDEELRNIVNPLINASADMMRCTDEQGVRLFLARMESQIAKARSNTNIITHH